ncbi:transposable element Tcb1 transposase [Trichonephila clavipes]|nr:transposable element Tcb1 transposase [Trichonephila clavipes]
MSGSGRPRQTSRQEERHIVRNVRLQPTASSAVIQTQRRESRFNLSSDDNLVRMWRSCGERFDPAFALHRHKAPTAGAMAWGAIDYHTRSDLVLIRGTMAVQRNVHGILKPHGLPLIQRLPGVIFLQDNAQPHTARVSQDCLHTVTTLSSPALSPNLSPIEHSWDHLGRQVGYPTSLNKIEAGLQQMWSEMSHVIIQNLYALMPDRVASCIRARKCSIGY